jgi:hypothetical protein
MNRDTVGRWWPYVAVLLLLALAMVATARSELQFGRAAPLVGHGAQGSPPQVRRPAPEPTRSAEAADAPEVSRATLPGWVGSSVTLLCLLFVVALVVALAWYGLRGRHREPAWDAEDDEEDEAPRRAGEDVVAALDDVLAELSDTDRDPRRAVIACWVRLERAAAAAGTPRQPGDTATDLVTRLLRGHRVSAEVLAGFAEIYREARYASHTVDEAMRTQARSALARLRAELASAAAPVVPGGGA